MRAVLLATVALVVSAPSFAQSPSQPAPKAEFVPSGKTLTDYLNDGFEVRAKDSSVLVLQKGKTVAMCKFDRVGKEGYATDFCVANK